MRKYIFLIVISGTLMSCQQGPFRTVSASSREEANPSVNQTRPAKITPAGNVISYADTVDRVAPAVVTVLTNRRTKAPEQYPFSQDPFFQFFFNQPNSQRPGGGVPKEQVEHALGSGVIVRSDGYILTNHHVI